MSSHDYISSDNTDECLGTRLVSGEDRDLLAGSARFIDDIDLRGMLELAFFRSSVPHGIVKHIAVEGCRRTAGVEFVASGAELPIGPLITRIRRAGVTEICRPLLAKDRVRFVGEAIAVVAASNRYVAEDAVEHISAQIDPLPAVTSIEQSLHAEAPSLHETGSNVLFETQIGSGSLDRAFSAASCVLERTFRHPRHTPSPMETRGVVAWELDGLLTVWSSTQVPHILRSTLAMHLGRQVNSIRVIVPFVGGGFGQKAHVYPEELLTAWLSVELQRPIKWIEDRYENLAAASHAREQHIDVRVGVDKGGRILGLAANIVADVGAYGIHPHGHTLEAGGAASMLTGPYRIDAYEATCRSVCTNKCPSGAYRGVGMVIATFVHERLLDIIASELSLDPISVRMANLVGPDEFPFANPAGWVYDSGDYPAALKRAADIVEALPIRASDPGKRFGIGFASFVEPTGVGSSGWSARGLVEVPGFDTVRVTVTTDGGVTVHTTLPSVGQGVSETLGKVVADTIGVSIEKVRVAPVDTMLGGIEGSGTFGSRSAIVGGDAAYEAGQEVRRTIVEHAARMLEASPEDLTLQNGVIRPLDAAHPCLTLQDVMIHLGAPIDVSRVSDPPAVPFAYGTHACIVAIDPDTGAVSVEQYVVVEDCGRILNVSAVEGQVIGATVQGISGVLLESVVYDEDGQPRSVSFMDYTLATAAETPRIFIEHLSVPSPITQSGAKGVGEGGSVAPPAAIANAVSNALSIEVNVLPMDAESIAIAARL